MGNRTRDTSKYCDRGKLNLEILTDLQDLSPPEWENAIFGMPSLYLYVCIYTSLASERPFYSYFVLRVHLL
jgi:hypothetical protein